MDAFKQNRPEREACRCCMPNYLKQKPNRIARKQMKAELEFIRDEYAPGAIERLELSIDGVRVAVDVPREAEEA